MHTPNKDNTLPIPPKDGGTTKSKKPRQLTLQGIINQAKGLSNADLKTLHATIINEIEVRRQQAEKELEERK